jgi:predicted RNA binding protein YcfA (HicA-like mRNA interferase family)
MDSQQLMRLLRAAGWIHVRTKGSHWQFKHPRRRGLVTVPHPRRDLPVGTVKAILTHAGIEVERR